MPGVAQMLAKGRAIVEKGPSTLRNIVYGKLGVWPVGRLEDERLRRLPTYCLSLRRATDRRRLMQHQADAMGLERFEIIDAVESAELSYDRLAADGLYDDAAARRYHGVPLSLNAIACSLSHAAAYDRIVEQGHDMALVLEDDALFLTRRVNRLSLDRLPRDAQIVFLNAFHQTGKPRDRVVGDLFGVEAYTGSSAAYLVSAAGAAKLAKAARPVVHAADGLLGRALPRPSGASPHPFKQIGVSIELTGYMTYPDCILNGSVCYYFGSHIPKSKAA